MRLNEALNDIEQIRAQLEKVESVRGFRSATTAASGLFTILGACLQYQMVVDVEQHLNGYLAIWLGVALFSAVLAGIEIVWRNFRTSCSTARNVSFQLIKTVLPCLLAGAVITGAMAADAKTAMYLPGLWSMIFALGLFPCVRLLPKHAIWVAIYYLLAGSTLLVFQQQLTAFDPTQMVVTFGVGQLTLAAILFAGYERKGTQG